MKAIFVAGFCAAFGYYLFWVEPEWLDVRMNVIGGNRSAEKIRVVQLSDLHLQNIGRHEAAVVKAVRNIKPDLIVLSGDAIDRAHALPALEEFLRALGSTPVVAVLGNWEYWSDVDRAALHGLYGRRANAKLLVNEDASFRIGTRIVKVVGLDDFTAGNPRLEWITHDSSVTTIAVQHSPGWFDTPEVQKWPGNFDLCLSGHTHGGQVTLFGLPILTPRGSGDFTSGFYKRSTCPIYVSRGIGTSILPIRFGARPEIAVFDL